MQVSDLPWLWDLGQKSKTGVSVVPQKDLFLIFFKKSHIDQASLKCFNKHLNDDWNIPNIDINIGV